MKDQNLTQWRFNALDTLFFKESRPMEAVGGAQLQSVFPPPARTMVGAVRTAVGDAQDVDWKAYAREPHHPLRAVIGSADSLSPLSFKGPYLHLEDDRLFPLPLALLHAQVAVGGEGGPRMEARLGRLQPSDVATACDLGKVKLPKLRTPLAGAKSIDQAWITRSGLDVFLAGGIPKPDSVIWPGQLYDHEERLGIGRDRATGTTVDGLLYQTSHVRLRTGVSVGIVVDGLSGMQLPVQGVTRLGAEGRLATWRREAAREFGVSRVQNAKVMLTLMTPAQFERGWLPDGLVQTVFGQQQTVWEGLLHGVSLCLISAVVGRPLREGGWDMVNRAPRTMDSLVPAGSCYFFEVLKGDANLLHGQKIGRDTEYGRGEIAVGNW